MKPNRMLCFVIAAGCALLPGPRASATEGPAAKPPVVELAKFGDPVIDNALKKFSEMTEVAVVQVGQIKELAARRRDFATAPFAAREQAACDIMDLLYPDQAGPFQDAYESMLDAADSALRKVARSRMNVIFGRIAIEPSERKEITVALVSYYRQVLPAEEALAAQYKDRGADPKLAEEYRLKREALLQPIRAKTLELAKGLLKADKQKEVDSEWKRRQERRIGLTLKDLHYEFAAQNDVQQKGLDAVIAAFRAAAKDLDLDSSDYDVQREKLRQAMSVVMNGK